jgi:cell division protein FtsQ
MMTEFIKNIKIKKGIFLGMISLTLFTLISFVEKKRSEKVFKDIKINIKSEFDNYFIDEEEVISLLTRHHRDNIIQQKYEDISLKLLEQRIKTHKFVEDAQVYKDHKGNLMVEIKQCRPIARVIQPDGLHAYIGNKGNTLTTSEKFTARVVIVDGNYTRKMMQPGFFKTEEGKPYFDFFNAIDHDPFLKAQIAQVSVENDGDIKMFPQVGDEVILFGSPEDIETKFQKLKIFYKKILPRKGWNKYGLVNLKYKEQIICE